MDRTSRRPIMRRDYGDMRSRSRRDYARGETRMIRDYGDDRRTGRRDYGDIDRRGMRDYGEDYRLDDRRDYRRDYDYDDMIYRPYTPDYGEDDGYLDDDDLMRWSKKLMRELPDNEKNLFSKDSVERKAKDLNITFGKDFTFAEFYTTALMLYTDFKRVLGSGNLDLYLRLAQAWLLDDDIDMDAGGKLCAYYEYIVNG